MSFDCLKDPGSVDARSRATEGFSATTRVFAITDHDSRHMLATLPLGWTCWAARGSASPIPDSARGRIGRRTVDIVVAEDVGRGRRRAWPPARSRSAGTVPVAEVVDEPHEPSACNRGLRSSASRTRPRTPLRMRFGNAPASPAHAGAPRGSTFGSDLFTSARHACYDLIEPSPACGACRGAAGATKRAGGAPRRPRSATSCSRRASRRSAGPTPRLPERQREVLALRELERALVRRSSPRSWT